MKKPFTRLFAILLAALLLCGAVPLSVSAEGVDITAAFTDPAFRAAVQELIGKDVILDTDVAEIEVLNIYGDFGAKGAIKNLAGLGYFTALRTLNCSLNEITSLPSLPSGLEELYCFGNELYVLPVLPVNLNVLHCYENNLTALPALPSKLISLDCAYNQLMVLPSLPPGLTNLDCHRNQLFLLPTLPDSLTNLWCGENHLAVLPALPPNLVWLCCNFNQLTSLDITGLKLDSLSCECNNMRNRSAIKGSTITIRQFGFYPQNPIYFWSEWPPIVQWALEYILFGWLWMRWL